MSDIKFEDHVRYMTRNEINKLDHIMSNTIWNLAVQKEQNSLPMELTFPLPDDEIEAGAIYTILSHLFHKVQRIKVPNAVRITIC